MIIRPGPEEPSIDQNVEVARSNSKRRVSISFMDDSGTLVDVDETFDSSGNARGELDLEVTDLGGTSIYSETYWPNSSVGDRRIIHDSVGKYSINFGTVSTETSEAKPILFNWHLRQNSSGEDVYRTQVLEVVTPRTLSLLPTLRVMLDKSLKPINEEIGCFVGHSDSMLIAYLKLGLSMINSYQPYPTFSNIDYLPMEHVEILIKSAVYQGIITQAIFAADTDIPSYSDNGHSFVIQHFPNLSTLMTNLKADLDSRVPNMKRQYVESGTASVELKISAAYLSAITASPAGALFRNMYTNPLYG